jgi:hypothetical protein
MRKTEARFEVFVAVKIQVKVFWVVILCCVATGYQCMRGPCCLALLSHQNITQCHNTDVKLKGKLTFILLLVTEPGAMTECTHSSIICHLN